MTQRRETLVWTTLAFAAAHVLCACVSGPETEELDVEVGPSALTASDCESLRQQLQAAEDLVSELAQELEQATGSERTELLQLLRGARANGARLRKLARDCANPPAPLPDLSAKRIVLNVHGVTADAALVIQNTGQGPAQGPFKIALGSTEPGLYREIHLDVDASQVIAPGAEYTTNPLKGIRVTRAVNGTAVFVFDALIDLDQQLPESNESDNSYHVTIRDHRH